MSRFSRLVVLAVTAALLVTAAPASAPATDGGPTATASKVCGVGDSQSYGTTYVLWIRARHVGCRRARRKVRQFHSCRQGPRGHCPNLGGGWSCSENRDSGVGYFYSTVRCVKGGKKVRQRYNQWT